MRNLNLGDVLVLAGSDSVLATVTYVGPEGYGVAMGEHADPLPESEYLLRSPYPGCEADGWTASQCRPVHFAHRNAAKDDRGWRRSYGKIPASRGQAVPPGPERGRKPGG